MNRAGSPVLQPCHGNVHAKPRINFTQLRNRADWHLAKTRGLTDGEGITLGVTMYKHILIATDGSELAAKGLVHGMAIAAALGAKITVLSVAEPLDPQVAQAAVSAGIGEAFTRHEATLNEEMNRNFAEFLAEGAARGVKVELVTDIDTYPAEAIVRYGRINHCDLIIMSSHGRRGMAKLILGSQTSEVLAHTKIPVLVIR